MNREKILAMWNNWKIRLGIVIVFAILTELVICNFSSITSIFNKELLLYGDKSQETVLYPDEENHVVVSIPFESLHEIKNLHIGACSYENEVVPYQICLTDEGNYYEYALPKKHLVLGNKYTEYVGIHPYGAVQSISIDFELPLGGSLVVCDISANVFRPVHVSLKRLVVILILYLMLYLFGKKSPVLGWNLDEKNKIQLGITVAVAGILIVAGFKMCHINPICITQPWPHHKQYQELADAMLAGHVSLDKEVAQGLLDAPNPYDTIYLQANQIDYQADYAYYNGKYYVYFGVVPVVMLYLPVKALLGRDLPNYFAVFLFYSGFVVGIFALYRLLIRQFFNKIPFVAYLFSAIVTVLSGNYIFMIARPDLYDVPIMAANMFTVWGLAFWILAKENFGQEKKMQIRRTIFLCLGSLCMALVAGCRPQMLLFSSLAVVLFWDEVIKKRVLFSKKSIRDSIFVCAPYAIVACAIMYYNAARFGSPFDFGATYSLTSNDMTRVPFSVERVLTGLFDFFLQPPYINTVFPFLQRNDIETSYMGRLLSEFIYGGVIACNAFTWVIFGVAGVKKVLSEKKLSAFVYITIAISVVIAAVDVSGAGILQRYMEDIVLGMFLVATVLFMTFLEQTRDTAMYRAVVSLFAIVVMLQLLYAFCVLFGNGDTGINVMTSNPALYHSVEALFAF